MLDGDPGDQAISVMVDIARTEGRDLSPGQRLELDHLVSEGFVSATRDGDGHHRYALTAKGQSALDNRGVGANEA
ncbi:hypothetical protein [Rhodopseudomonas sp. B29]|uniref:hypothetical protein n=1 Tax=Rhodopseudomonas sp. B29 TaxID=95607 RepID=UPI00034D38B5|nr:hypothetical protein [Rhodopseudomonas sp. B29]